MERNARGLSWPVKATLLFIALLAGYFDHAMSGWGRTVTMAAAAIAVQFYFSSTVDSGAKAAFG